MLAALVWRAVATAALMSALVAFTGGQANASGEDEAAADRIRNVSAYAKDGAHIGVVVDVETGPDGEKTDVHISVGSQLGIGEKIVSVPAELTITLRGALVVMLTADEVARLRPIRQ
jgi:hypothetical protein